MSDGLKFLYFTVAMLVWGYKKYAYRRMVLRPLFGKKSTIPERFYAYVDLYMDYWWQKGDFAGLESYQNFITKKLLPCLNKILPVKLLRGIENEKELLKLIDAGAECIFTISGPDAQLNYVTSFEKLADGQYVGYNGRERSSLPKIPHADREDRTKWGAGIKRSISIVEAHKLLSNPSTNSEMNTVWRAAMVLTCGMQDPYPGNE